MNRTLLVKQTIAALVGVAAAAAILLPATPVRPADQEDQPKANEVGRFMHVKLKHSQSVLEGLTTEDYDLIAKGGQAMSLLSQEAQWQVLQTPEYARRSSEFRRSANALTKAAEKRSLDGATLAFVDVTLKCVECHKYVRTVK